MIILKHIIFVFFFIAQISLPQNKNIIRIPVDSNFDIMKTAEEFLGNKNYWPYLLKYNKLLGIEQIKKGMTILIPANQFKSTFAEIKSAKKSLSDAIDMGAKILAEDLVNNAENYYKSALKSADNFDFDASYNFAQKSKIYSKQAYLKTKEIRNKTVDAIVSYKKGILQKRRAGSFSWIPAELYESLLEKDFARTLSKSNAQITFYDLSQIRLNENSQVIIQSSRYDPLTKKSTSKVKLEKGDAFALLQGSPKKKFDIDIPGINTKINSKYFWLEKGNKNTKLANYNGEIQLEAQNQTIVVQKNQGSVIPDGGIPSKPIALLDPPLLLSPSDQSQLKNLTINFSWNNNPKASAYWIELARDANFKSVIGLTKNITVNNTKVTLNESGVYYWRVCAVDDHGLPGPFSETFTFATINSKPKPFIMLQSMPQNIFTQDNIFKISGKTSVFSVLKANDNIIEVDSAGNFNYSLSLQEGKNALVLSASDSAGNISSVSKNIYYETSEQLKIINLNTNTEVNGQKIFTNIKKHRLELKTIPYALVSVKEISEATPAELKADSTGQFIVSMELTKTFSQFEIYVESQTGLKNKALFEIYLDNEPPFIELDIKERAVNYSSFNLSGRTDAKTVFINGQSVSVSNVNSFQKIVNLTSGENLIEIKAYDEAGNQSIRLENIFYDNLPPVLIEHKINLPKRKSENAVLIIKATDQTQLKKFALVNYLIGIELFSNYAILNESNNCYEFEFNNNSEISFISVELEDYFANKKLYELKK